MKSEHWSTAIKSDRSHLIMALLQSYNHLKYTKHYQQFLNKQPNIINNYWIKQQNIINYYFVLNTTTKDDEQLKWKQKYTYRSNRSKQESLLIIYNLVNENQAYK